MRRVAAYEERTAFYTEKKSTHKTALQYVWLKVAALELLEQQNGN